MNIILYGPPGVGKTAVGQLVAERLGREFVDGDEWIEARWDRPVPDYFARGEEPLFRAREAEACRTWSARDGLVIAPGGGALLDPHSRAALEASGVIICLTATLDTLLARLNGSHARPLLGGDAPARLAALLKEREKLYRSFALRVSTDARPVESVADAIVASFHANENVTRFELGDCSALMGRGLLARLPEFLRAKNLRPPFVVISDSNVAPLHGDAVLRALSTDSSSPLPAAMEKGSGGEAVFPAGEFSKTLDTVRDLYAACLAHGLERGGTVLALGGGVVGDVAGFVAATFMRGVRWVNLPTTVLAMADASLGGKVGVDLPEGKNLVGAFHPPALVVADFDAIATLPEVEIRCGLAEIVKAAVIGDPDLFRSFTAEFAGSAERKLALSANSALSAVKLDTAIRRGAAVKVGIVNADPYEHGERAKLNYGHTIGHGVEAASGYAFRHGEAVAIGMVAEARLAESLGLAESGLAERIADGVRRVGLPTHCAGLSIDVIRAAMGADKKKARGKLKFALPQRIGEVVWGVEVEDELLAFVLESITHVQ
jgi:3-dehydroquinate synthase